MVRRKLESVLHDLLSHSQPTAMRAHYGYLWVEGLSRKGGLQHRSIFHMCPTVLSASDSIHNYLLLQATVNLTSNYDNTS